MATETHQHPAVRFEKAGKTFNDVSAVVGLDFAIEQGEFFSLLGPSGCGKTTTLRLIAGFEIPNQGKVFIDGADVSQVPPYRRNVNTVFQSYALFPHLDVFENIAFGLRRSGRPEPEIVSRVGETLEMVNMQDFEKRNVKRLSGGQQQRVALARALVNRPKVLLLDEPMAALDSSLKKKMQRELKGLQQQLGITFVLVTHDQEEALTLSDRIAVMSQGRAQQVSSPRELYRHPCNQFVAEFIGKANFLPVEVSPDGVSFQGRQLRQGVEAIEGSQLWMLRPEVISVSPEQPPEGPFVKGTLTAQSFAGAVTRQRFQLADGTEILCEALSNAQGTSDVRSGEELYLSWNSEEGQFLAPEEV